MLDDMVPDVVDLPVCAAQQPLHPIRADITRMLRQRPAILPPQARDQPGHILTDPGPRFRAPEPARDPLMHPVQLRRSKIDHHAHMMPY